MSLGTLSIDIEAKLAKLDEGMTRATRLLDKNAAQMERAFVGVSKAFTSLVGVVGVGALAAMTRNVLSGVDALNDFADATGTSVENASALEDIALRTGTSFEAAEGALVKFNSALASAKKGSDQAAVFEKLGLDVERLKKLDPAEALLETAKALDKWADDGDKARIVAELFGKSVREVGPLLKDLAEKGELNATVTTEQAKAVEKFNQQISALQKNMLDLSRSILGDVVPALNAFFEKIKLSDAASKSKFSAGALSKVTQEMVDLQAYMDKQGSPSPALQIRMSQLRDEADRLTAASVSANTALKQLTGEPAGESWGREVRGGKPSIGGLQGKPGKDGRAADAERAARERVALAELAARAAFQVEEESARDTAEAWEYYNKIIVNSSMDKAKALELQTKQVYEFEDQQREQADEEIRTAYGGLEKRTEKVSDAARDLGMTFSSAFEDAIINGEKFGDVLKSLDKDITRILLREIVTKPLASGVQGFVEGISGGSGSGAGFDWGSLLAQWFAGSFATGGYVPPGQWGLMGERGPEPVFGGRTGVTVLPNGAMGGGGNITVNIGSAGGSRMTALQQGETIGRQVRMAMARNG